MASSCASDIRSVTVAVASSSLGISDATTRTNSLGCVHAAVISAGLPKACHASQRSRKNFSLSLLREPFGRPLGLPDWPGLNWVNSLPVTCFPPVDLGLRLTIIEAKFMRPSVFHFMSVALEWYRHPQGPFGRLNTVSFNECNFGLARRHRARPIYEYFHGKRSSTWIYCRI